MQIVELYDPYTCRHNYIVNLNETTSYPDISLFVNKRIAEMKANAVNYCDVKLYINKRFADSPSCEKVCNKLIDFWLGFDPQRAKDFRALCLEHGFIQ